MPSKRDVGRMRQRLTYQTPIIVDRPPSAGGVPAQDYQQTWEDGATYWASVEPQSVRRTVGVDTPKSSLWYLITMRNPGTAAAIAIGGRFMYGTRILVIDSVQRVDELNAYLEIESTENPA